MAGPNAPTSGMLPASNELRASVFDAALQLGLMNDDRFAEWIFDERAIAPENNIKSPPLDVPIVESVREGGGLLRSTDSGEKAVNMASNSVNSSSTSLNEHVRQLEEAYAALATTRLTRAATRKTLVKTGGRTGPSHQASQSEVLSFSREDAVAGLSSTLARSATFSSRSLNPLSIDSSKSNAPFITVTPALGPASSSPDEDPEVSYVSTVWGKELLQSYDIELTSAPATPVSNSPFSKQIPLPSASPTNTSFTSSESSLHTPSRLQLFPVMAQSPPIQMGSWDRDKLPAKQQVPTDVTESPETTPTIPPTPPLIVRKNTVGSPTSSTHSGPFVPATPSSTQLRLPSPPPTPYSAASPDSPTIPWMKASALPPLPPRAIENDLPVSPSRLRGISPTDQRSNQTSPRSNFFSLSKSTSSSIATSSRTSSPRQTPPQSPYTSLFSRLSFKRKSKSSTTATPAESRDASPIESQFTTKELPPIPPSARAMNSKALSSPNLNASSRVPVPQGHASMNPLIIPPPRSAATSPVSPASKQQMRGRISPFPVKPIRKQPLPPSPASPTPQPSQIPFQG